MKIKIETGDFTNAERFETWLDKINLIVSILLSYDLELEITTSLTLKREKK